MVRLGYFRLEIKSSKTMAHYRTVIWNSEDEPFFLRPLRDPVTTDELHKKEKTSLLKK